MSRRSLRASPQGIKQAKIALDCKSLTQKALAEELQIASWSTVNKFFTGKFVDRKIFISICEALDLEWEDIVSPQPQSSEEEKPGKGEKSVNSLDELSAVQCSASRSRHALDPYILPRIRRSTLLEKCLKAIQRGTREQKRRVIPIIGPAGYGKSTILGNIYDELDSERVNANSGWIALVRCNDLIESVETFATELGEKTAGKR